MEVIEATVVASEHVTPLNAAAEQLSAQVDRAEIVDDDSFGKAGDLYKLIATQIKKGEDARGRLVKPLNDHVKWINGQFKPVKDGLQALQRKLKSKMDSYAEQKRKAEEEAAEAARKQAEEEALAAATKLEAEGKSEAAEAVVDAAASLPDTVSKNIARGNLGSSTSTRVDWKGEVVDMKAFLQAIIDGNIPEDFIEVSQAKLNKLATDKKVEKTNFGIRLYKKVSASVR